MKKRRLFFSICLIALPLAISACNIFEPFDSPSTDAQLLSAARAAFDQGRFEDAADYYSRLSADYTEIAASESAFQILDQYGASMGAFMSSFGKGGGEVGKSFTRLAAKLAANGGTPGEAKRQAIFEAFKKVDSIPNNPSLRGVIRFAAASALLAELLAENIGPSGIFTPSDLVKNPSTCQSGGEIACAMGGDDCDRPTHSYTTFEDGGPAINLETATDLSGPPTFQMVNAAFEQITKALSQEIAAGGALGGSSFEFSNEMSSVFASSVPNCYRYALLTNGIGVN